MSSITAVAEHKIWGSEEVVTGVASMSQALLA